LGFAVIISGALLWRTVNLFFMTYSVEVRESALVVKTILGTKHIKWPDVQKLARSDLTLPEGFILKTKTGKFLIASNTDAIDELEQVLKEKSHQ
jgi:hypothetical protein